MSIWIVLSWVFVAVLTAINIFIFLKLKQASEQMMQMAFPGAKNMNEAMSRMQSMMRSAGKGGARPGMPGLPGGFPGGGRGAGGNMDAQLKAAMDMLQKMQKGGKR